MVALPALRLPGGWSFDLMLPTESACEKNYKICSSNLQKKIQYLSCPISVILGKDYFSETFLSA